MLEIVLRTLVIGAGATLLMDVWAAILRRFGIPSLDFARLGRLIAPTAQHPRLLGWVAHYTIGIGFAALLVAIDGIRPSLGHALLFGLVTVAAPLFILQPALGAGIASSKTPRPLFNATKSVVTHLVFGAGLYLTASAI